VDNRRCVTTTTATLPQLASAEQRLEHRRDRGAQAVSKNKERRTGVRAGTPARLVLDTISPISPISTTQHPFATPFPSTRGEERRWSRARALRRAAPRRATSEVARNDRAFIACSFAYDATTDCVARYGISTQPPRGVRRTLERRGEAARGGGGGEELADRGRYLAVDNVRRMCNG
jgi:hypothetical protein